MTKQRLPGLEFLRAACALIVLLNHAWGEGVGMPAFFPVTAIASYSIEAVMGFFVLSGCVISMQDYPDAGAYMRARLVRLLPIYYSTLILALAGMAICGVPYQPSQLAGNVFFLQTQDWSLFEPLRFFIPSWSLSYELYYYVAFVAILALPRLLLPLLAASIVAGVCLYSVPRPAPPAFWLLHVSAFFGMWLAGVLITRLWRRGHGLSIDTGAFLLMIGLCLSHIPFSHPAKFDYFRLACFSACFACFVWALLSQVQRPAGDDTKSLLNLDLVARGIVAAVTLALLWHFSHSMPSNKWILSVGVLAFTLAPASLARQAGRVARPAMPVMLYVAGLSYALYLVHYPLVQTFNDLAFLPPVPNFVVVVALSFALAHLLDYRLQPWVRARFRNHRPAAASSSSSSMRT